MTNKTRITTGGCRNSELAPDGGGGGVLGPLGLVFWSCFVMIKDSWYLDHYSITGAELPECATAG